MFMFGPKTFQIPTQSKLVDEDMVQALRRKQEDARLLYQPQQGWLDSKQNEVEKCPEQS